MGNLVFLVALAVAVTVIGWFITNEIGGASGEHGLLAINADPDGGREAAPAGPAARYRLRERPTPGRPRSGASSAPRRAYRVKPMGKPITIDGVEGAARLDEDF